MDCNWFPGFITVIRLFRITGATLSIGDPLVTDPLNDPGSTIDEKRAPPLRLDRDRYYVFIILWGHGAKSNRNYNCSVGKSFPSEIS